MTEAMSKGTQVLVGMALGIATLMLFPFGLLVALAALAASGLYLALERDPAAKRRGRFWVTVSAVALAANALLALLLFAAF